MNLEKLNLVELNAQEVQETEGGLLWYQIAGAIITAAIATYDAVSDMHAGYVEAYKKEK
jgi:hypothetical protein